MATIAQLLEQYLFSEEEDNAYVILDGASVPELLTSLDRYQPEYECLYRGELEPDMAEVAPYLIRLEPDSDFTDWVLDEGWGKHWGIFAVTDADLRAMRRHFRAFLIVHDADGNPLYFRYYDPRVLRLYLPTCSTEEMATVFGPVLFYLLEDEDPNTVLRFRLESGELRQEKTLLPQSEAVPK